MITMILLIVKIFFIMGFGLLLKVRGLLSDDLEKGISGLLLSAILPLAIVASGNVELTDALSNGLRLTALATAGYFGLSIVILYVMGRYLPIAEKTRKILVLLSVFANTAFLGFPLMLAIFGEEGVLYAAIYNMGYQLVFFTWGVYQISSENTFTWRTVFCKPVTAASLIAVLLVLTPMRLPVFLQDTVATIGGMTTPLSLLLIGSSFAKIQLKELFCDGWCYLVSLLRLVVFPLAMLVAMVAFGVSGVPAAACCMMTALPSGSLTAIYAEQYNCAQEFATRGVVQSTLFMLFTFPLILILVRMLLL